MEAARDLGEDREPPVDSRKVRRVRQTNNNFVLGLPAFGKRDPGPNMPIADTSNTRKRGRPRKCRSPATAAENSMDASSLANPNDKSTSNIVIRLFGSNIQIDGGDKDQQIDESGSENAGTSVASAEKNHKHKSEEGWWECK